MKSKVKAASREGYHHGDLRRQLIEVGERLLEEEGVEGFTMRECARRAGVSPSAPSHHFGSVIGLMTAIATLGFEGLSQAMESALVGSDETARARVHAIGMAYIRYAIAHPARFQVTFGQVPLDRSDPTLKTAGARALGILAREIRALRGVPEDSLEGHDFDASVALAWSAVHGLAQLLIDGHLSVVAPTLDREALVGELVARSLELLGGAFVAPPTIKRRK